MSRHPARELTHQASTADACLSRAVNLVKKAEGQRDRARLALALIERELAAGRVVNARQIARRELARQAPARGTYPNTNGGS